jgi:hypothetical protein
MINVPLYKLDNYDPFKFACWHFLDTPITMEEVQAALDSNSFEKRSCDSYNHLILENEARKFHAERIAYLVVNKWENIWIDVGFPSLGLRVDWIVVDGNHRHAAARFCGDETILADITRVPKRLR